MCLLRLEKRVLGLKMEDGVCGVGERCGRWGTGRVWRSRSLGGTQARELEGPGGAGLEKPRVRASILSRLGLWDR